MDRQVIEANRAAGTVESASEDFARQMPFSPFARANSVLSVQSLQLPCKGNRPPVPEAEAAILKNDSSFETT